MVLTRYMSEQSVCVRYLSEEKANCGVQFSKNGFWCLNKSWCLTNLVYMSYTKKLYKDVWQPFFGCDEALYWLRVLNFKWIKLNIYSVISFKILFITCIVYTFQKGTLEKTQFKIMKFFSMLQ